MNKLKPCLFNPLEPTATTATKWYNANINGLSSQGAHQRVLSTYYSMLSSNTPPDPYTFPSLLKACTCLNLLSLGLSIHQHVVVNGFSSDSYIASALINFYSKFGYTANARQIFDVMPEKNVVPWSTIIGCYSRSGDVDMAFSMYNEMRYQGVEPSSVTFLGIVSGVSELTHVQCLHACATVCGFLCHAPLVNAMLNMYGKCGRVEDAKKLFELINEKDIVSWNSLISGYAQIGNVLEILWLLCVMRMEGMEPDQKTFGFVVSAGGTQGNLRLGKLLHGLVLRSGFDLDVQLETSLTAMYLKCGDINAAFRIFERLSDKDVVSWTAIITGLVQNDCADQALFLFREMVKSRVELSTATIASGLAACAQLGSIDLGASVHGYILRQGMTLDIPAQNSLVTMYAKCGLLDQSCAVFEQMDERDLVSWNAIVTGYAQNGHLYKALSIFSDMRKNSERPDSITVVSLLQACASIGALHQGKWFHNFAIRNCLGPCIFIDTALVDMYSKCGDLDLAQKCFDAMSKQDVISWSAIIAGHGCHGQGETALRMYSEFLHSGIEPNHVIFLAVLSACSHNGLVQQGLSLFQSMTKEYGIDQTLEHRACIVDLLCRAGRVEEAYNCYKRNFLAPMVDVLGIILDACRVKGKMELANIIAREILVLRPGSAGNYVQLAHSYASMNRWDGVGEAWTQMRSLGLKKLPGWSFIELHGTITTFFMDHNSHPQFEEVVSILKMLSREMKKMGI